MGTLFQKALYFKKYFSIGFSIFFLWPFMFTENWNKTGKITAKIFLFFLFFYCDSLYIKCIIQLFPMV